MKKTPYDYALLSNKLKKPRNSKLKQSRHSALEHKLLRQIRLTIKLSLQLRKQLTEVKGWCSLFVLSVPYRYLQRTPTSQDSIPIFAQAPLSVLSVITHSWLFSPILFSGKWKHAKFYDCSCKPHRFKLLMQFPYIISMETLSFNDISFFLPCTGSLNLHISCSQKQAWVLHVHLPQWSQSNAR